MTETQRAELTMHTMRLMRSGRFPDAKSLMEAIRADFPDHSESEIKDTLADLCRNLMRNL